MTIFFFSCNFYAFMFDNLRIKHWIMYMPCRGALAHTRHDLHSQRYAGRLSHAHYMALRCVPACVRARVCVRVCVCLRVVCLFVYVYVCVWEWEYLCVSICLSACRFVCLSDCLSVCMSICLSVCLYVCLSVFFYLSVCLVCNNN